MDEIVKDRDYYYSQQIVELLRQDNIVANSEEIIRKNNNLHGQFFLESSSEGGSNTISSCQSEDKDIEWKMLMSSSEDTGTQDVYSVEGSVGEKEKKPSSSSSSEYLNEDDKPVVVLEPECREEELEYDYFAIDILQKVASFEATLKKPETQKKTEDDDMIAEWDSEQLVVVDAGEERGSSSASSSSVNTSDENTSDELVITQDDFFFAEETTDGFLKEQQSEGGHSVEKPVLDVAENGDVKYPVEEEKLTLRASFSEEGKQHDNNSEHTDHCYSEHMMDHHGNDSSDSEDTACSGYRTAGTDDDDDMNTTDTTHQNHYDGDDSDNDDGNSDGDSSTSSEEDEDSLCDSPHHTTAQHDDVVTNELTDMELNIIRSHAEQMLLWADELISPKSRGSGIRRKSRARPVINGSATGMKSGPPGLAPLESIPSSQPSSLAPPPHTSSSDECKLDDDKNRENASTQQVVAHQDENAMSRKSEKIQDSRRISIAEAYTTELAQESPITILELANDQKHKNSHDAVAEEMTVQLQYLQDHLKAHNKKRASGASGTSTSMRSNERVVYLNLVAMLNVELKQLKKKYSEAETKLKDMQVAADKKRNQENNYHQEDAILLVNNMERMSDSGYRNASIESSSFKAVQSLRVKKESCYNKLQDLSFQAKTNWESHLKALVVERDIYRQTAEAVEGKLLELLLRRDDQTELKRFLSDSQSYDHCTKEASGEDQGGNQFVSAERRKQCKKREIDDIIKQQSCENNRKKLLKQNEGDASLGFSSSVGCIWYLYRKEKAEWEHSLALMKKKHEEEKAEWESAVERVKEEHKTEKELWKNTTTESSVVTSPKIEIADGEDSFKESILDSNKENNTDKNNDSAQLVEAMIDERDSCNQTTTEFRQKYDKPVDEPSKAIQNLKQERDVYRDAATNVSRKLNDVTHQYEKKIIELESSLKAARNQFQKEKKEWETTRKLMMNQHKEERGNWVSSIDQAETEKSTTELSLLSERDECIATNVEVKKQMLHAKNQHVQERAEWESSMSMLKDECVNYKELVVEANSMMQHLGDLMVLNGNCDNTNKQNCDDTSSLHIDNGDKRHNIIICEEKKVVDEENDHQLKGQYTKEVKEGRDLSFFPVPEHSIKDVVASELKNNVHGYPHHNNVHGNPRHYRKTWAGTVTALSAFVKLLHKEKEMHRQTAANIKNVFDESKELEKCDLESCQEPVSSTSSRNNNAYKQRLDARERGKVLENNRHSEKKDLLTIIETLQKRNKKAEKACKHFKQVAEQLSQEKRDLEMRLERSRDEHENFAHVVMDFL